jgi:hypothetical protein
MIPDERAVGVDDAPIGGEMLLTWFFSSVQRRNNALDGVMG